MINPSSQSAARIKPNKGCRNMGMYFCTLLLKSAPSSRFWVRTGGGQVCMDWQMFQKLTSTPYTQTNCQISVHGRVQVLVGNPEEHAPKPDDVEGKGGKMKMLSSPSIFESCARWMKSKSKTAPNKNNGNIVFSSTFHLSRRVLKITSCGWTS